MFWFHYGVVTIGYGQEPLWLFPTGGESRDGLSRRAITYEPMIRAGKLNRSGLAIVRRIFRKTLPARQMRESFHFNPEGKG